jgi:hypothetical protein
MMKRSLLKYEMNHNQDERWMVLETMVTVVNLTLATQRYSTIKRLDPLRERTGQNNFPPKHVLQVCYHSLCSCGAVGHTPPRSC